MLAQLIVSGLAAGALYGLLALGFVMIYKTSDVLSFAQGEIAMVNTFFAFSLVETYHVPFWWAFALTVLFAWCLGLTLEFVFLRPARNPTLLGLIIITLGFDLILYGLAGWTWGYDTTSFPSPFSDFKAYNLVGGVVVSEVNLWIFVVSLGLMALLFAFFRFTRLGVAMRAVAQNRMASRIMGIRIKRINAMTWGLGSVLGAVAGVLIAPITFLDINMGLNPGLKAFTAAVLGGMTSMPGAVVGGLLLGVLENVVGAYVSPELKVSVAFFVIIAVLCIRPAGLFGHHYRRRV
jgi:branched-chain amino acid transport system permease protein